MLKDHHGCSVGKWSRREKGRGGSEGIVAKSGKRVLAVIGLGCILKGELVGLADGLYVGCEKKAGADDGSSAT